MDSSARSGGINMNKIQRGFTIIEIIVVLGILATLLSIGYVRFTDIARRAPLSATVETVIADLRGQQTKAMSGYAGGGSAADDYGVYFDTNSYTLFKGPVYSALDSTNAKTLLPDYITCSSVLPDSSVVFTKGDGEVLNYSTSGNTITLTQTLSGEQKTITINRYGAVLSVE